MARSETLDAHERPPAFIKNVYKFYQKLSRTDLEADTVILDLGQNSNPHTRSDIMEVDIIPQSIVHAACCHLQHRQGQARTLSGPDARVYEAKDIPGLRLIPSLVPEESQKNLLSQLLHRGLADQRHKTNVHLHYQLPYSASEACGLSPSQSARGFAKDSFFNISPKSDTWFLPFEDTVHKPFTVLQFLSRKLRWLTLGGQYNWTQKCYPLENPPFPGDVGAFIHTLFPEMKPEAAIVNVYTPGDTLGIHRDVSEDSDKGLVSISLGCDGIFVVGLHSEDEGNSKSFIVRLRSGDAVFMTGPARFAWHGVPQIISDTCPTWLCSWPAKDDSDLDDDVKDPYGGWRGWMANKRINLNVRQMKIEMS